MLPLLMMLGFTGAVAAEGTPREWVLTVDDLKGKLGAHFRPDPRDEKFQHGDFVVSAYYVYTYIDLKRGFYLISQVNREISSFDAQMSYLPMNLGANWEFDDSHAVDRSKTVAAGDSSRARQSANGRSWMFNFRQRNAWGMLILSGVSLTPKEMDALVDRYVARVNLVQVRKKPKPKPKGIWRWP